MAKVEEAPSPEEDESSWEIEIQRADVGLEHRRDVTPIWSRLRQLTSLSVLELGGLFLVRPWTAQALLRLGPLSIAQLRFVMRSTGDETSSCGQTVIWPKFADRIALRGGLAEDIARGIKGERRRWTKNYDALRAAVVQFGEGPDMVRSFSEASSE
jgi:hypothetical protein